MPVVAAAGRKAPCDVGDVLEVNVVEDDELPVAGRGDVLLEVIGTLTVGERFRLASVLGEIAARAAVRDDERALRR